MFKVKISDAKILRDAITAISTLIEEATFTIDQNGIKLRSMDPSRVAMVDFSMEKDVFDEYISDKEIKIGISLNELLKLLKRSGKNEAVELFIDEKTGKLVITIQGKYVRTFRMPILDAREENVPTPKIPFNSKITLTTTGLRQSLEDVALVGDYVRLESDEEKLTMSTKGDIMGADIELKKGSEALLSIEVKEPSKSTFPLSYLSDIIKAATSTSDIVDLHFSTDMPLRLNFKQIYEGKLVYYLAPRVEVE